MSNEGKVSLERRETVAVITIDHPPVNALSPTVFKELAERFAEAGADDSVEAIVLAGAGKNFSAGMDLSSVDINVEPEAVRKNNVLINEFAEMMEDSAKPVVAAVKGATLGGGLEFAMSCHYRVAADAGQLGQPEVSIGLIPGMGGTQRCPRLVGLADGLMMVCGGRPVKPQRALDLGLVDEVVPADELLDRAVAFAIERVKEGGPYPKSRERADKLPDAGMVEQIFQMAAMQVQKQAGQMTAPLKALEAVKVGVVEGYEQGRVKELDEFIKCMFEGQAPAMINVFFAQRATTHVPGMKDLKSKAKPVNKVAVVGGGLMGRDIAFINLLGHKEVALIEVDQDRLDAAVETIRGHCQRRVDRGRMSAEKMNDTLSRLKPTLDYADIADVDLVIEAVFEKMEIKKEVLGKINDAVPRDTFIGSNTSTLPITELAAVVDGPERVIGLHFFSPARVMPLLEIVRTAETSEETIATSFALAKAIRKTPILVKDCYGFLTNRVIFPYVQEGAVLVMEGAGIRQVDDALVEFGMRMGSFTMGDMAGIDIGYHIAPGMMEAYPDKYRPDPIGAKMFELGRYGQKAGKGFYKYEEGSRQGVPDPDVDAVVDELRKEKGITPREISADEIVERMIYMWINECAGCLEEGVALSPGDVDIATVMGFGFPPWRGGIMYYAKQVGYKQVHDTLAKYADQYGGGPYTPNKWLLDNA